MPPEGHTCPVPHTCPGGRCQGVLGRDDVRHSAGKQLVAELSLKNRLLKRNLLGKEPPWDK